jgi:hypothetical protein
LIRNEGNLRRQIAIQPSWWKLERAPPSVTKMFSMIRVKAVRPTESKRILQIPSSKDKPHRAVPRINRNPPNKLRQD